MSGMSKALTKGSVLLVAGILYVLVEVRAKGTEVYLYCICDHANNIFSWELREVDLIISAKDLSTTTFIERPCPWDVVCEVLLGEHDNRFRHWDEES